MKKGGIPILIVVAIIVVVGFVPLIDTEYRYTETFYEDEPYEVMETYYVDEPYEVTETYTDTELLAQVEIIEDHMDIEGDILWVRGQVRNSSNTTFATIDVSIHATCPVRDVEDSYVEKSVVLDYPVAFNPGEVRDFSATFDRNVVEDGYTLKVYQPLEEVSVEKERTVTKYRQVEQERTVTEYRQVEKERLIIQYERVSIFEYLRFGKDSSESCPDRLRGTWVLQRYGEPGKLRLPYPCRQVTLIISHPCATAQQEISSPVVFENGISGYAGVNWYGGCYEVDGSKFITGNIWHYLLGGPSHLNAQEDGYLDILRSAETYEITNCRLIISSGEELLVFRRKG